MKPTDLLKGADLALDGAWDRAHTLAQSDETDAGACWLHAILHKIEGDEGNSRYWYARAGRRYDAFSDAEAELRALKDEVLKTP